MPIKILAGQILTADDVQALAEKRLTQGSDQSVVSSTTMVESSIVIPVDDLFRVGLRARYTDGGGGFRWDWDVSSGSVSVHSRSTISPGSASSGNENNVSDTRIRAGASLATDLAVPNITTTTAMFVWEELIVEGVGDLTLRFAQDVSNANATTLNAASYAIYQQLAEG